jgi:hypothetical protein
MHFYRVFGLVLRSELELPDLAPALAGSAADVAIVRAPVPVADEPAQYAGLSQGTCGAILTIGTIGRFRIRDGNRIEVDTEPQVSERSVRIFLLGPVMGALLWQRRMFPLHANAIDFGGFAAAFAGSSGAGKSTLAALFLDRGRSLLSDDICVIAPDADDAFLAEPGIPRVRLWRDAVERTGRDPGALDRVRDGMDKYVVPTIASQARARLPLRAIYTLAADVEQIRIRRLKGVEAVRALTANTYRPGFMPLVGSPRSHFALSVAIAGHVPIYELARPWGGDRLDACADRIEAHLAETA